MTDSRSLTFYVALSEPPGAVLTVSHLGRSRSLSALGTLWNSDSVLDQKAFRLNLIEGNFVQEMKSRDEFRKGLHRDSSTPFTPMIIAANAIGAIAITQGAEPGEYEPPLQAAVYISRADYDASLEIISASRANNRLISVTLTVQPEQEAKFIGDSGFYAVKDINLADGFKGDVTEFAIGQAIYERIEAKECAVELPPDIHHRKPTTDLEVRINEIGVSYSMPSGYLDKLQLGGKIVLRGAKHLDGAKCYVTLSEYEREDSNYPRSALSGSFFCHKPTQSMSVDLCYRRSDIDDQFKMLLASNPGDVVRVRLRLHIDSVAFEVDGQRGDISSWGISYSREL